MNKKGTILIENIIFIILNLIFIGILILFILKQGGGAAVLEESYAKQIAMLLDSAKSGMKISLNMKDAIEIAEENNFLQKMVFIDNEKNIIRVQLSEKGGYEYSFFNDLDFSFYRDKINPDQFIFIVNQNV